MEALTRAIILSILPVSELRGGLAYALVSGVNFFIAFVFCVVANLLVIPAVFLFLDYIHRYLIKNRYYGRTFDGHVERSRRKLEKHIGTKWEFIFLMLFVAVPLPLTGAYTGTLLAWFFKLDRKKSYLALSLGVLIAAVIVSVLVVSGARVFGL